jgi:site-specific recombinase XerD
MAILYKQIARSNNYLCKFKGADGKWISKSTGTDDRRAAERIAFELEKANEALADGVMTEKTMMRAVSDMQKKLHGKAFKPTSVKDYIQTFIESKNVRSTDATMRSYKHKVELFVQHLGDKADQAIGKIKSADIQSYMTKRLKGGVSVGTLRQDMKVLTVLFGRAKKEGICELNPVATVDLPLENPTSRTAFTIKEVKAIIEHCPNDEWKTLVMISFYTGARIIDCTSLTWGAFDFESKLINYQQRKIRKGKMAYLSIPMHESLYDWLLELRLSKAPKSDTPVMPSFYGKKAGGKSGPSTKFIGILIKSGIDPEYETKGVKKVPKKCFHSFRHTLSTLLQHNGVAKEARMSLVGHSSSAVHSKYSHAQEEVMRKAIATLPSLSA